MQHSDPGAFPDALTPDDVFAGAALTSPVVIYDDEHYFMGGALAEKLADQGFAVTLITPDARASAWTAMTDEQGFVQARLMDKGVRILPSQIVTGQSTAEVTLSCTHTQRQSRADCATLILVTGRLPDDALYRDLTTMGHTATRIGDCLAPSSVADAVYSAHRFARNLGQSDPVPLRRERPTLAERG